MKIGNLRFRTKAVLLATLTTFVAMALSTIAFVSYERVLLRRAFKDELDTIAQHIGAACTAAIRFDDPATAAERLELFRGNSHVVTAVVYGERGQVFARYPPTAEALALDVIPEQGFAQFTSRRLMLLHPIIHDGRRIGAVYIERDLSDLSEHLWRYTAIGMAVLAAAMLLAALSACYFQRILTRPVNELLASALCVSRKQDYSVRAKRISDDELGTLTDAFNDMLVQIQRRDGELGEHRQHLERLVHERTAKLEAKTEELVRSNVELQRPREAAEAGSRAKSTFLANMSHEIRTPLNGVIGMTELVLKSPLSAQQREYLMTVRDSGEALLTVINDILDFSKIEAGKLVLESNTFDLRESLGDTMKSFALRAHQQGLELACFIHADVPHMVVGDYNRLRQVVVNLVGNAVKFTEKGEVCLDVTQQSRSERNVVLHFVVSDTGIGIPREKQSTIFEMFEQADGSTTRRHGGTGLGLAIATRLAALMDGRIWLESEVGRGSRFHFMVRLGLGKEEPRELVASEPACLHEMRALVVDDNATNRHILEEILRSWRMIPASAASVEEALGMLRRANEASEPYQLVVTDAHMPQMDGFALAERIKQNPAISTVIMMLTSGDRPEDIARCNELGIAAYLLKPVKQSELLEAIELALGITVPREELLKAAAQQPHHVPSLHILLAEDSLVNQKLAVALLEGQGYTVTLACNGKEAVAATSTQNFDLVLMDVQMPEMDGLEATGCIRAREQHTGTHVPIIAMTAHALKGDRERCLEAGMDNYVSKPIRARELFETINAMFIGRKPAPDAGSADSRDLVDWAAALRTAEGDLKVLKSMTEAALEEIPQLMTAIRQAIAHGDRAKLKLAAHTLKGAVRYFGVHQLCEHASQLEEIGHKGNLVDASPIAAALEGEVAKLTAALSESHVF